MKLLVLFALLGAGYFLIKRLWQSNSWKIPKNPFPSNWRNTLIKKVNFYKALNTEEKKRFEFKVQEFLLNCRITGIETTVNEEDCVLVAASAIIPIFSFPNWKYTNLYEVLIYPGSFNDKFETETGEKRILGMVGTGYMEGKMILSKKALHSGFANETDRKNTAVHEFVHLIDKMDGTVDGVPEILLEKQYALPWIELMSQKIDEIAENNSDINPYGGTNKAEFLAVAGEYFFERPKIMEQKHPKLYNMLEEIFNHDMSERNLLRKKQQIGRNSPCPCGSGNKFKKCCGKVHY